MKKFLYGLTLISLCSCNKELIQPNGIEYNGHIYETVVIGSQEWFSENLITESFNNGDPITQSEWGEFQNSNVSTYSVLECDSVTWEVGFHYNYYVVMDERNVCPVGWRVPNKYDFELLINTVGGEDIAGYNLKTQIGWSNINTVSSNSFEFDGYPNFMKWGTYDVDNTPCNYPEQEGLYLWSDNPQTQNDDYIEFLQIRDEDGAYIQRISNTNESLPAYRYTTGMGIRCVKE